ncbi:MAG: hypothetical protein AB8G96_00690 [Phycisphaerales bacterium]
MNIRRTATTGLAVMFTGVAAADVDLEFRVATPVVNVGDSFEVQLFAVSDDDSTQLFSATETIFAWNPAEMVLLATTSDGAIPSVLNTLPAVGDYGLNEAVPPADGDGILLFLGQLGAPAEATPEGALLHTFSFQAIAPSAAAPIDIPGTGGKGGQTLVVSGKVPGLIITGMLLGVDVEILGDACFGDFDRDGMVGFSDLLSLLGAYGTCVGCPADLNGDGEVAFDDVLALLSAWGPC